MEHSKIKRLFEIFRERKQKTTFDLFRLKLRYRIHKTSNLFRLKTASTRVSLTFLRQNNYLPNISIKHMLKHLKITKEIVSIT